MADISLQAGTGIDLTASNSTLTVSAKIQWGTADPTQTPPTGNPLIYIKTES